MRQVIHWRQAVPILITLSAMLCGFFSILVAVEGRGVDVDYMWKYHVWAAQLILAAIILDGLDGIVARRLNGCSPIGAELDTYVDMTAFGIAPAVLIYVVCLQSEPFRRVLMTAAVVLSGVVRLARFKATDPHRGQMGYSGLPITACASWVALFVFISQSPPRRETPWLTYGPWAVIFLLGVMLFIVLQVSNVRYPKPTKRLSVFILGVVLVIGLLLPGVRIGRYTTDVYAAVTMVVLGLGYVFFGPLYIWRKALLRSRQGHPAPPPPAPG